jgi:hypothetical protein
MLYIVANAIWSGFEVEVDGASSVLTDSEGFFYNRIILK